MGEPLGVELGRLARPATAAPFEAIRIALLDRLIAAEGEGALSHPAWESAFAEAATALRDEVVTDATASLTAAAKRSRAPAALLKGARPDGEALLHRLLACGMPLEQLAEEAVEGAGRRRRAAALEEAWGAATTLARVELRRAQLRADEIAAWRRPLRPLLASLSTLTALLAVVAAWLGGQLTPPEWFRAVHEAFWRLPWP